MKDMALKDKRIFEMIHAESRRQIQKWGIQDYSPFEWLAFLTEEMGELSEAIQNHEYHAGLQTEVVKEAIQTATLAVKIAEMYLNKELHDLPIQKKIGHQ